MVRSLDFIRPDGDLLDVIWPDWSVLDFIRPDLSLLDFVWTGGSIFRCCMVRFTHYKKPLGAPLYKFIGGMYLSVDN